MLDGVNSGRKNSGRKNSAKRKSDKKILMKHILVKPVSDDNKLNHKISNIKVIIRQYIKMAVQNILLPTVYCLLKPKQIEQGLIIFADAHNEQAPSSMAPLIKEVKRRNNKKVVEIYDDYQQISFHRLLMRMLYFMKYYARAEYVVICDNFLPVASCKKRKETTVIQLWHGCGAFKKFGYDTQGDIPAVYKGNVFRNYDIVTVSAPGCAPHFQSAMRLPKKVFQPFGVCRTDKYFKQSYNRSCRELFEQTHEQARGKKIVLWAPTFRGYPSDPKLEQYEDVVQMCKELPEDIFVIIKVHPHLIKKYPYDNSSLTTDQLLPVTDLLITDYSSIIFEYSIYQKPMLFYAPDMKEYGVERGFYLDYQKLPGTVVTEQEQLAGEVIRALEGQQGQTSQVKAFYEQYMSACDGKVTKRLADRINA